MGIEEKIPEGIILTTVAKILNTARKNSVWPAQFGLVEIILFIVTVFVAYAYVWRRGGLDWD